MKMEENLAQKKEVPIMQAADDYESDAGKPKLELIQGGKSESAEAKTELSAEEKLEQEKEAKRKQIEELKERLDDAVVLYEKCKKSNIDVAPFLSVLGLGRHLDHGASSEEEASLQKEVEELEQGIKKLEQELAKMETATPEGEPVALAESKEKSEEPQNMENVEANMEADITKKFEQFGITQEDLENLEGFRDLSEGQKLLALENLKQITLGRIQDQAQEKFQAGFKKFEKKKFNSMSYDSAFSDLATNIGIDLVNTKNHIKSVCSNVWRSISKNYQVAKLEKNTLQEMKGGGMEAHGEILKQLVKGMKEQGPDVELKDGKLEFQYARMAEGASQKEKESVENFNQIATEFAKMPYEWSLGTASKSEQKKYKELKARYDASRSAMLFERDKRMEDKTENALEVNDIDRNVMLNQFLNNNPDVEAQLQGIQNDKLWAKALKGFASERGAYMVGGFAARTAGLGMIGLIGAPIAAAGMGGLMAFRRERTAQMQQEKGTRKGKDQTMTAREKYIDKFESATEKDFVDAQYLNESMDFLMDEVKKVSQAISNFENGAYGSSGEHPSSDAGNENSLNKLKAKREEMLRSLKFNLKDAQMKMEDGTVNFGEENSRFGNQYELVKKISEGHVFLMQNGEGGNANEVYIDDEQYGKDLEEIMEFVKKEQSATSSAQNWKKWKKAFWGGGIAAGFAVTGFALRHFGGELFGWKGAGKSLSQLDDEAKARAQGLFKQIGKLFGVSEAGAAEIPGGSTGTGGGGAEGGDSKNGLTAMMEESKKRNAAAMAEATEPGMQAKFRDPGASGDVIVESTYKGESLNTVSTDYLKAKEPNVAPNFVEPLNKFGMRGSAGTGFFEGTVDASNQESAQNYSDEAFKKKWMEGTNKENKAWAENLKKESGFNEPLLETPKNVELSIRKGSSIEGTMIKNLMDKNPGMPKSEAGKLAHFAVLKYAESQGIPAEKLNLVHPGAKLELSLDGKKILNFTDSKSGGSGAATVEHQPQKPKVSHEHQPQKPKVQHEKINRVKIKQELKQGFNEVKANSNELDKTTAQINGVAAKIGETDSQIRNLFHKHPDFEKPLFERGLAQDLAKLDKKINSLNHDPSFGAANQNPEMLDEPFRSEAIEKRADLAKSISERDKLRTKLSDYNKYQQLKGAKATLESQKATLEDLHKQQEAKLLGQNKSEVKSRGTSREASIPQDNAGRRVVAALGGEQYMNNPNNSSGYYDNHGAQQRVSIERPAAYSAPVLEESRVEPRHQEVLGSRRGSNPGELARINALENDMKRIGSQVQQLDQQIGKSQHVLERTYGRNFINDPRARGSLEMNEYQRNLKLRQDLVNRMNGIRTSEQELLRHHGVQYDHRSGQRPPVYNPEPFRNNTLGRPLPEINGRVVVEPGQGISRGPHPMPVKQPPLGGRIREDQFIFSQQEKPVSGTHNINILKMPNIVNKSEINSLNSLQEQIQRNHGPENIRLIEQYNSRYKELFSRTCNNIVKERPTELARISADDYLSRNHNSNIDKLREYVAKNCKDGSRLAHPRPGESMNVYTGRLVGEMLRAGGARPI